MFWLAQVFHYVSFYTAKLGRAITVGESQGEIYGEPEYSASIGSAFEWYSEAVNRRQGVDDR